MNAIKDLWAHQFYTMFSLQNQRTGDEPAGGFDSHALPPLIKSISCNSTVLRDLAC
jgi:hypothetical protein